LLLAGLGGWRQGLAMVVLGDAGLLAGLAVGAWVAVRVDLFVSPWPFRARRLTWTTCFKEAGLGNEPQVHVVLSATALCINGGGKHPKAVNKTSVNAAGDFPVQNGKAEGALSVTATFQPACSPPMTVQFTDVTLTDQTSGITANIPGTF